MITNEALKNRVAELEAKLANMEKMVKERTTEFDQILNSVDDAIVSTDLEGTILSWNPAAEDFFGWSAEEAIGKNITIIYKEEDIPVLLEKIIKPTMENGSHEGEYRVIRKDGTERIERLRTSVVLDDKDEPVALVGISVDITERKQAEEQLVALNRAMIGREDRIVQVKQEVNILLKELGRDPAYAKSEDMVDDGATKAAELSGGEGASLVELVDLKSLETSLSAFCLSTGIASAIIDLKGNVLVGVNWKRICTDFHRVNKITCQRCIESDIELANQLQEGKTHAVYLCKNGLTDAASPIIVGGRHLANAFVGQFLLSEPDEAMFRQQARQFGFDEDDYIIALNQVPRISEDKLPFMLDFLTSTATMAASMGIERQRALNAMEATQWQQERRRAAVSLMEDAEATRESLSEANRRMSLAADAAGFGVWDWDLKHNVLIWDDWMYRLYGVDKADFGGTFETWQAGMHPDDVEYVTRAVKLAIEERKELDIEFRAVRPNGEVRNIKGYAVVTRDQKDEPERMIGINYDITERKQTEKDLSLFRQAIDGASDAVRILNFDGSSIYHNQAYIELAGYTVDEINSSEETISLYQNREDGVKVTKAIAESGAWNGEFDIRAKDGRVFPAFIRGDTVKNSEGNPIAVVIFGTDITEQKEAEVEKERLQQEVIEAQQRAIQELSVPIIPVMDQIIVMPLIGSIDSMRASDIMRTLLVGITEHRAKIVIMDITGVPIVDTGVAAHLDKSVQAARLKGARTIITGISDAVAETIIDLGIDWSNVETLRDLQTGLMVALESLDIKLMK
ncbi:PAS domain S-box protein [Anaerolineales bacterium HSG24]|nr:PAS domain S-box protein [Anaerolineales bacterium HSG24]